MHGPDTSLRRALMGALRIPFRMRAAIAIAAVAVLPLLWGFGLAVAGRQPWLGHDAGPPLFGFVKKAAEQQFGWWDRSFQTSVGALVAERLPFRNWLVRINNELDYRILRSSLMHSGQIVIGKDGVLLGANYIAEEFGYHGELTDAYIRELASQVKRLHALLAARGISVIVVGTPSKLSVMRDAVPGWYREHRAGRPRNYQRLTKLFTELDVPFIDGRAEMLKSEFVGKVPLFPRGGIHWTAVSSYAATRPLIARLLRERSPDPNSRVVLDAVTLEYPPEDSDRDFLLLLNLLSTERYPSPRVHLHLEGQPLPKPAAIVGSSFMHRISALLERSGVARNVIELFYMEQFRRCADCEWLRLSGDWPRMILDDTSALILEINEVGGAGPAKIALDRLLAVLDPAGKATPPR